MIRLECKEIHQSFVSTSISEEMLALEQIVIHKPFYGINLCLEKKWSRTPDRKMMNDPGFKMYYDLETKHIEKNKAKW